MSKETEYTSWDNAFIVEDCDLEVGRVWFETDTGWNIYHGESDQEYDFIEQFEDAVELLQEMQTESDAA